MFNKYQVIKTIITLAKIHNLQNVKLDSNLTPPEFVVKNARYLNKRHNLHNPSNNKIEDFEKRVRILKNKIK